MQSAIKVVLAPSNGCGDADLEDVMWYGWMQRKLQEAGIACRLQSFPDPNMAKESVWLPFLREELLVDDNRTQKIALSQRALVSVASGLAWLELLERSTAFDAANKAHATAVDREAARLVSHSQTGAGAWLRRLPDGSVKGSVVPSDVFISAMQRRLGLYISVLRPGLDAAAHDRTVTQHERLGDKRCEPHAPPQRGPPRRLQRVRVCPDNRRRRRPP